jgi:hypothetical protein
MCKMPLCRSALTVHKAWTVRPKCLPWCTSGSVPQLITYQIMEVGLEEVSIRLLSGPNLQSSWSFLTDGGIVVAIVFACRHDSRLPRDEFKGDHKH